MVLRSKDFWAGLIFFLIGLLLFVVLIPAGIVEPKKIKFAVLSPSFYPRIVAIAMLLIGAAVLAGALRNSATEDGVLSANAVATTKVCAAFAIMFATAYALPYAGFVLSACLALVLLMVLAGERNPLIVGLVAVILPLFLYVFFTKVASVPIPGGILDPYLQRI